MATNLEILKMNWNHTPNQTNYEIKEQIAILQDEVDILKLSQNDISIKIATVSNTIDRINNGELDPILQTEKDSYLTQLSSKLSLLQTQLDDILAEMNTKNDNVLKLQIGLMISEY